MELIAHRGMPRKARENTLAGFELAIEAGVDGIELDVHATADGVIVVHHDLALRPPAGDPAEVPGPEIRSMTFRQLRHESPGGDDVPTLGETLRCISARAFAYVEIKGAGIESLVLDVLKDFGGRAAVHSFDHRVSLRCRLGAPDVPTGILSSSYLIEADQALLNARARDYWQWWELIDPPLVEQVHAAGGRVIAWTVNSTDAAAHLRALGVDGVCTDIPDVIGAFLRRP